MLYNIADELINFKAETNIVTEKFRCFISQGPHTRTVLNLLPNVQSFKESHQHLSVDQCELIASLQEFFRIMLQKNKILIHATTIVIAQEAHIFLGGAGVGKSTLANSFLECSEINALILSDDRTVIGMHNGQFVAWATPWSKRIGGELHKAYHIKSISILSQKEICKVLKTSKANIINFISQNYPDDFCDKVKRVMDTFDFNGVKALNIQSNINDLDICKLYEEMCV